MSAWDAVVQNAKFGQIPGISLLELRSAAGLTQGQLAALTKGLVSQHTISYSERTGKVSFKTAYALCSSFGVSVEQLMGESR